MSSRNIIRQWLAGLTSGDALDLPVGGVINLLPVTNDQGSLNLGDGSADMDLKVFLGATTSYAEFNVGDSALNLEGVDIRSSGAGRVDLNGLPTRFSLKWAAGQRGKPGLNADILSATEATRMVTDPDFEVLGTNASSDDVTFGAEGGIVFTTDGADGDAVILLPHLDANQSAWTQVTWGTDKQTEWECEIITGADITNSIIWAGLKLTNTATTATDADQVFFRYENGVNDGEWQAIDSIGGTDSETDSGVAVAASTKYHLKITIDSSRIAQFYINGVLVSTSSALTDATDLIPYIGVEADGAAEAKTLNILGQSISRVSG